MQTITPLWFTIYIRHSVNPNNCLSYMKMRTRWFDTTIWIFSRIVTRITFSWNSFRISRYFEMQTLSISIVFFERNHALIICTRFLNYGLLCSTNKYSLTRKIVPRLRVLEDYIHVILYHLIYETMSLEMFDVVNNMWGLLKVLLISLNPELY